MLHNLTEKITTAAPRRKRRRALLIAGAIIAAIIVLYAVGPDTAEPVLSDAFPAIPATPIIAESILLQRDARFNDIKPDNHSRVIWLNSESKSKTDEAILYLHGFSASWREGSPVILELAKRFQANLLLYRLSGHGRLDIDAMAAATPDNLYEDAKQALTLTLALGDRAIIVGSSTGATLSLMLAAAFQEQEKIAAQILYSPNIRISAQIMSLASKPWGAQLLRLVAGGNYHTIDRRPDIAKYWLEAYPVIALANLQQLLDSAMQKRLFKKITLPTFVGYYYRDQQNQDKTVDVPAILWMTKHLSTPANQTEVIAFPNANNHVIASDLTSDAWPEVASETQAFIERILRDGPRAE